VFHQKRWSGTRIAKEYPTNVAQKTSQAFLSMYGVMERCLSLT